MAEQLQRAVEGAADAPAVAMALKVRYSDDIDDTRFLWLRPNERKFSFVYERFFLFEIPVPAGATTVKQEHIE